MSTLIKTLKEEWIAAKYTPRDDTSHLLPEDDPEYEPYELSVTYEDEQCRSLIKTAEFPSMHMFMKLMQDWCLSISLRDLEMADACAQALCKNAELAYTSVARLFYAIYTDEFEAKARSIGETLNKVGYMPMMWVAFYGFSNTVKKMEHGQSGKLRWAHAFHPQVSAAWNNIGDWQN